LRDDELEEEEDVEEDGCPDVDLELPDLGAWCCCP
jgi:hypothetical protein